MAPEGRISPQDLGLWKDDQVEPMARVVQFIKEQGPWRDSAGPCGAERLTGPTVGRGAPLGPGNGGWAPVRAASAIPFDEGFPIPRPLKVEEIGGIVDAFVSGAERALEAGFQLVEIHGAHGYLLHSFLSPLSNERTDDYGGSFENRTRFLREVVAGVRQVWPAELPLLLRISCTDWMEGGWDIRRLG